MTRRSAALALLGAAVISGFCYFNDCVIRQGMLIPHLMPVVVYGGLVFFLLFINPILKRLGAKWVLSGRELAVIVALVLASCAVPSWGLIQCLPTSIMMPHHFARLRPAWSQGKIIERAPERMLPDVSVNEDHALNGYVVGLGEGDRHIAPWDVPWYAWGRTLCFWIPLLVTMLVAMLGLALVFHRQWIHHEQLPYPISIFAHALLPGQGDARSPVFRTRLFWVGSLVVFLIHMNNYACKWWPQVFIPFRLYLDFTPLAQLTPTLMKGQGWLLLRPHILFSVVGLAYFIPSDVSFSMAVVPFIFCYVFGFLTSYGIVLRTGDHLSTKIEAFIFTGGYLGILLMLVYTGRHYYWNVLRRALRRSEVEEQVEGYAVWGMRAFLAGTLLFIVQLVVVGLDWQVAVLYTGLALMIFIVVSRTIAETGAFHIGSEIFPAAILMGFFGSAALGLKSMIIMFLVSVVILPAPGWAPMPFVVQSLKLAELSKLKISRTAGWTLVTLLLCVAIAVPVTIYWQYDRGAPGTGWPRMVSSFPFENAVKIQHKLEAQGTLELSDSLRGWRRFAHMSPTPSCVIAFFIALGLALGIGLCRLRFARWPIHPVVFVFLGGYQAKLMSGSFLLGWLIKTLINKYGGADLYQRLKPLMFGIIAGDMFARLVPMVAGTIYYAATGRSP